MRGTMKPDFVETADEDLVDSGLPRESPFRRDQCQIQSSLLKHGDAFSGEMSRERPYYDKTYQSKPGRDGGNPFASKRNEEDQVVTQPDLPDELSNKKRSPKDELWMKEMGVKTSKHHKDPEFLPPRDDLRDNGNEEVAREMEEEKNSSLLKREFNHQEAKKLASSKVAKIASLRGVVPASNIKTHDQHLMINIPRGTKLAVEFTSERMATMEKEISKVLHVRAKYSHFILNSAFDGIALEFLLV